MSVSLSYYMILKKNSLPSVILRDMLSYSRQHSTLHFLLSVYNFVIHGFYIQIDRKCHEKTLQE
jgi:hypothetical protein